MSSTLPIRALWSSGRLAPKPLSTTLKHHPLHHLTIRRTIMSAPLAQITSIDHVVLTVANIDATIKFYQSVLGMKHESFTAASDPSVQRHALVFGQQKINLHKSGAEFEPKAANVMPGSGDLCFITDTDVNDVLTKLRQANIEVLEGNQVVDRTGARGKIRSVYIRDPDGNLVEISNYV